MKRDFIAVIDSGIGGLTLLRDLVREMPDQDFLYFGDNKNTPYGNKTKRELMEITLKNVLYLRSFGIGALVVACNTLSLNLLKEIEDFSEILTFGIFPPVENSQMRNKKTLLLSTPLTAKKYGGLYGVDAIGLNYLVKDIENNVDNLNNIDLKKHLLSAENEYKICLKDEYDEIILGCTHFPLIKNKFFDHFKHANIKTGNYFTVNAVKNALYKGKCHKNISKHPKNNVFFVGENANFNSGVYYNVVDKL